MNDENNDVIKSIDGVLYYKYDYADFLYQKLEGFKSRIDKAVETINYYASEDDDCGKIYNDEEKELLDILKGDDENEK